MGNNQACGCDTFPGLAGRDFNMPDLKRRSYYGEQTDQYADSEMVRAIFNQAEHENRHSKLVKCIAEKQGVFEDENFPMENEQTLRLVVLFDFSRIKARIYTLEEKTSANTYSQLDLQLSYLTTVYYLLSHYQPKNWLLPKIIDTAEANKYGAYSLNFYCNGQPHHIIIDDRIPTRAESIQFLRIAKGNELWPLLIEKAWAKQIGSYKLAKGLSPEDCFEEITGIPAYTYAIRANNRETISRLIQSSIENRYWVALVAQKGLSDIRNRQVFNLRGYSVDTEEYVIMSPYRKYKWLDWRNRELEINAKGEVRIKEEDLFTHFEYVVVGYWKPLYAPTTLRVECESRKQMLFELTVDSFQDISIRFNQLYRGYLGKQARLGYKYSPVLMELYQVSTEYEGQQSYSLVQGCQGCGRAKSGARSAHFSPNVFEDLQGRYILRLLVEWEHQTTLRAGNLVMYSREDARLTAIHNTGQLYSQIYKSVISKKMSSQSSTFLSEHDLRVLVLDQRHSTVVQFVNLGGGLQKFEVDFSKSSNVFLRGEGDVDDKKVVFSLEKDQSATVELLPFSFRQPLALENFEVVRWKSA